MVPFAWTPFRFRWVVVTMAVLALSGPTANAEESCRRPLSPIAASGHRLTIFISDLHLGVGPGGVEPGGWSRLEDFRWNAEFARFLGQVTADAKAESADGKSAIDLVLLGDTFELWQSLQADCDYAAIDPSLGCTVEEAVARAERVVAERNHLDTLQALAEFATQDDNRVTLVPGNHDAALLLGPVQEVVLGAIQTKVPDAKGRVRIATEGYWRSADGRVYAEHGHQIGDDVNQFDGWPEKITEAGFDGKVHIIQPAGEGFVQHFYNQYELQFPTIDNLAEESLGISYGYKAGGKWPTMVAAGRLARFLLMQTSWEQEVDWLGTPLPADGSQDPVWDVAGVRASYSDPSKQSLILVETLAPGDPLRVALESDLAAGRPVPSVNDLTDEEIRSLCSHRWTEKRQNPTALIPLCPGTNTTLGGSSASEDQLRYAREGLRERLFEGAKFEKVVKHMNCIRDALPTDHRPTKNFELFVYAHTHGAAPGRKLNAGGGWEPVVINDGAWQRTASRAQLCSIAKEKHLSEKRILPSLLPEDLPACYPFVYARVEPGTQELRYGLLYWTETSAGWRVQGTCNLQGSEADCRDIPNE